jgi:hypothetical protein
MVKHKLILAFALIGAIVLGATRGAAHEIRPAIADISFGGAGGYAITISLNLEALIAEIGPEHEDTSQSANASEYDRLRSLPSAELRAALDRFAPRYLDGVTLEANGERLAPTVKSVEIPPPGDTDLARISEMVLGGALPASADALTLAWDRGFGAIVVRVTGPAADGAGDESEVLYSAYLQDGATSDPMPIVGTLRKGVFTVFGEYLEIGFTHILPKGLDHILFVVGLFLLSTRLHALLWQITSFTLAHSVTLALGVFDVVQISPSIVEPLIAASIVYVCIENVVSEKLQRWRPAVVFGFGLLHGLGFAGVLTEIGLQPGHYIAGLVAFNVGVELGQLTVIAGCFLAVGLWFRNKPYYRKAITIPASVAIAMIGAYWFVERTFL